MIGPFPKRQLGLIAIVALTLALVLVLATTTISTAPSTPRRYVTDPQAAGPRIGSTFVIPLTQPTASGSTWGELQGAHAGTTLVIVNFFATWCPPCQQETPILRAFDRAYRARGLILVSVSVNEAASDVAAYGTRYSLEYPLLLDRDGALFRAAQAGGLPTQLLLDPNGRVLAVLPRPLTAADGPGLIEPLLASP